MARALTSLGGVAVVDVINGRESHHEGEQDFPIFHINLPEDLGGKVRYLRFWVTTLKMALQLKPRVVVAEDFLAALPGFLTACLSAARLLYDAHELIIPEPGRMTRYRLIWYFLERCAVRKADLVIAANEDRARLMAQHYKLKHPPLVVLNIPQAHDPEAFAADVLEDFPCLARRTDEEIIMIYQGIMRLDRGMDRFIDALHYLPSHFRLLMVGEGEDLIALKEMAASLERDGRVDFLGRVAQQRLPAITRLADIGILAYPFEGLNNKFCAPNKIYEYAQAGLPVVATDQPPLRRLVKSYGIGELVTEETSPERLAGVLTEVAEKKYDYKKALAHFLEDHKWEDNAFQLREAVQSVLQGKSPRS